jgi:hypothetical protein
MSTSVPRSMGTPTTRERRGCISSIPIALGPQAIEGLPMDAVLDAKRPPSAPNRDSGAVAHFRF